MAIREQISLTGKPFNGDNAFILDKVAFDIGTRVIKWWEPDGFSQYDTNRKVIRTEDMATGKVKTKVIQGARYKKRKGGVSGIKQIFLHHSGADRESPKIMREVLHNQRGLSVQFATEDDGRIYQFLDAVTAAKHAGRHNPISIGNECCLWPDAKKRPDYYSAKNRARNGNLPHKVREEVLQGMRMKVFCFPEEQVDAVCRWAAGLWYAVSILAPTADLDDAFPMPPLFPRNAKGEIPRKITTRPLEHVGLIGHLHASRRKWDPAGFPWEKAEEKIKRYFAEFADANTLR